MNDLKYQFDLRRREKDNRRMRTMDLFGEEMEDQITTMAMDVDDVDNFDILSEVLFQERSAYSCKHSHTYILLMNALHY
ncbi:hypothetical protein MTR_1g045890 [Medicago truncatula]|uniref:Uncharacterized protein n=1 Tax=Medicago truncatula TaxID=3880 RepID=G7I784_MEDTR|nr:hypothetical protein MTR_1g045890 [Medicago truncatula]